MKALAERVREVNAPEYRTDHGTPPVEPAPLPAGAQLLDVIESVFSGMLRAVIQNSNYESIETAKVAIDRHFAERGKRFPREQVRHAPDSLSGQPHPTQHLGRRQGAVAQGVHDLPVGARRPEILRRPVAPALQEPARSGDPRRDRRRGD